MGYGKLWKVPTSTLQSLIANADSQGNCKIEVWSDTADSISSCELWLKLATAWSDKLPPEQAEDPNTPT